MHKRSIAFVTLVALVLCLTANAHSAVSSYETQSTKTEYSLTALSPPALSARSAVLIDADSCRVLCGVLHNERMAMASTTKIMTALVAAEAGELDRLVSVSPDAVGIEGSSIYLYAGEKLTLRDLICAMLLESANDAAAAIAIEVGGSIEGFCAMMNEKAKELGLCDTHFTNPHGLYDEEHYTTAYELAVIASRVLANKTLRKIVSSKKMTVTPIEGSVRVLYNHNKMLAMYDGAIGIKTGFTKKSGRCLVSAAERNGLTLIAVTLDAPDDWRDHTSLLDLGFESFERLELCRAGEIFHMLPVMGGKDMHVPLVASDTLSITLNKDDAERLEYSVNSYNRYEFAPLKKESKKAELCVSLDGKEIASVPLVCANEVSMNTENKGISEKIKDIFK